MSAQEPGGELLQGAYDLHVHAAPDVIPRAQDLVELAEAAKQARMAGLVLKDHTSSTAGRAYALNQIYGGKPHFFGAVALNPPVGGLNPYAVEAALRQGADIVWFPTYGARHQIAVKGPGAFARAFPRPRGFRGITVLDQSGGLKPEVHEILKLIAAHDAVLATGHISPRESLALLEQAKGYGVRRMIVTHASEPVPGMTIGQQLQAVGYGAFIEHCLLAIVAEPPLSPSVLLDQIRQVGVEHVIISSDLGQVANGAVVPAFSRCLDRLLQAGATVDELHVMICVNPRRLMEGRVPR